MINKNYILVNVNDNKEVSLKEAIKAFGDAKVNAMRENRETNINIANLGYLPLFWWDRNLQFSHREDIKDELFDVVWDGLDDRGLV